MTARDPKVGDLARLLITPSGKRLDAPLVLIARVYPSKRTADVLRFDQPPSIASNMPWACLELIRIDSDHDAAVIDD